MKSLHCRSHVDPFALPRPELERARRPGSDRLPREATRTLAELDALLVAARELDELEARRGRGGLEARIACASLLGLRQGELAGLEWGDVDFDAREVAIARG